MKRSLFLSLAFMAIFAFFCNAQDGKMKSSTVSGPEKVEAYYFHFTSRCATCLAVENEARENIKFLYGSNINFKSINLDDASSKEIAKKLKVSGQSLLIVKEGKQINLTNDAFLYAKNNPEKFKSILKEKIDKFLL